VSGIGSVGQFVRSGLTAAKEVKDKIEWQASKLFNNRAVKWLTGETSKMNKLKAALDSEPEVFNKVHYNPTYQAPAPKVHENPLYNELDITDYA